MDILDDAKGGFRERSVAVGKQAALQKQLQDLQKSHQDLAKRYEAKDQKCDELRSKLTTTKAVLSGRERELEGAQRVLHNSAAEKKQLKEDCADKQVYIRRLEAKLEELQGAADAAGKYQAAKQKVYDQQKQLAAVTAELQASQEQAERQQKELDRANRMLEIRISELSEEFGGSSDVPAQLLHSLAESREESLLLAKQLAAAKADLQKVKASSSKLSRQLETEQILRTDAEGAAEALKQRLEKLLNGSKEANKHRTDMAEQLAAAKSDAEALKTDRDQLAEVVLEMQEELEQLKAAAAHAAADKEAAVDAAAQKARRELREARAQAAAAVKVQQQRSAQLNQRCSQLAEQAGQLESALRQQVLAAQQTAASRQQRIMVLETQLQARRQHELELEQQVAELTARVAQLSGQMDSAEAASKQSTNLERQVARLEAALRVATIEKEQVQQRLQQHMDDVESAQQESVREADGLRVQLAAKDVLHRCALQEASQLQGDVQELGQQMQDLAHQLLESQNAKAQLQQDMRRQITGLKEKLQQARQMQQAQAPAPQHAQRGRSQHSRPSRSPPRRSRSPPLPSTTNWEVAPTSPAKMQLLTYSSVPLQCGTGPVLQQYGADSLGEYAYVSNRSPSRSPGRSGKAAAATGAVNGAGSVRGQGSSGTGRRRSLTEMPGDWGILSAAGYVGEAAAAAIDAARRGKLVAAARKLHTKHGKGAPAACSAVGMAAGTNISVLSGVQFVGAGLGEAFAAAGDNNDNSSSIQHKVTRSSFDLGLLGTQSEYQQQQGQQQGQASVLSTQQRSSSAIPAQRPSRSADNSSIVRPSHSRALSCDLTAAAAALDAEVTAVLSGSCRGSPTPSQWSMQQRQQQQSLPQPALSAGSRHGTPTSAAPRDRAAAGSSVKSTGPMLLSGAAGVSAGAYGVCQLLSPRSRHASECTSQPAAQAAPPAAAAGVGSSWHDLGVQTGSSGSPDRWGMQQQQQQQQIQQQTEQEYSGGFCSPRSATPTPRVRTAPVAAAAAAPARAAVPVAVPAPAAAPGAAAAAAGGHGADNAGAQGPMGAWRHTLTGPVEPYSPSVVATSSKQRTQGQTMTDPYSLPASAETSYEVCHAAGRQQQQQWPASGPPKQQQPQQPHKRPTSPLGRGSRMGKAAGIDRPSGACEQGGSGSSSPSGRQQQQQQQQQQPSIRSVSPGHGLQRHSPAGEQLLAQEVSHSSAADSKVSVTSAMIDEISGAWEVPQFSGSEGSDSDSSGRRLVALLDSSPQRKHRQHAAAARGGEQEGAQQQQQLLPGAAGSSACHSSGSGGSSSSHGRVQPPAGPRPAGSGRSSRQQWHSTAITPAAGGGSATGSDCSGVPLDASSRPSSDRSTASFGTRTGSSQGGTAQQQQYACMGDPVGSGCQQLVWQALSEGGHDVQTAVPPQAGSSGSRRSSSAGSNCNGSTVGSGAAAAPGHSGGSSCPVPMIAAALLPSRGAAPAGSANGGRGPDSGSWRPQQQFHTAAELLSPPSTCKAARGSRGAAGRGRDVAHLARPLSEEMLTDVHEAPDDSWLMPYEPQHHHQHHQQQQQQRKQQGEQQQRQQLRRSSGASERLPANPSLSSWQASGQGGPSSRVRRAVSAAAGSAAAAAQGSEGSRLGAQGSGSQLSSHASGSRIEALLDDFEQGVTPSLLDLAEL